MRILGFDQSSYVDDCFASARMHGPDIWSLNIMTDTHTGDEQH